MTRRNRPCQVVRQIRNAVSLAACQAKNTLTPTAASDQATVKVLMRICLAGSFLHGSFSGQSAQQITGALITLNT